MAGPRLPKIEDVLRDPSIAQSLPTPLLAQVVDQLKQLHHAVVGAPNIPPDPVQMAIKYPKWKWMESRHILHLGESIADVVDRQGALLVCMPPRHAKTVTCSIWTPFWYLAKNPESHVLFVSYEANFAAKWSRKVRDLVAQFGAEYGLILSPDKTRSNDWELESGGGMQAVGAGGGVSGKPAQLLIVDDAIKDDEEARSDIQRANLWDWWDGTANQRIEPDTIVIAIGTRWREDDFIGQLIKHSDDGTGHKFDQLILPAMALENDPLDRRPGEGLWLDNPKGTFTQAWYEGKKNAVSNYTWEALYQQNPTPPGGNMVDPEWWGYYRPSEMPREFDQEVQSWDLSLDSSKKTDSYHAGLIVARKGAMIYVRDTFHEHCGIDKVMDHILAWNRIYPTARQKLVERATAGVAVVQMLRTRVPGMIAWPPKGRQKGSKEACLDACIPDIRSRNILLPLNPDGSKPKWVQEFIHELQLFPKGQHDDWVDSFSQAVGYLLPQVRSVTSRDHSDALAMKPEMTPMQAHVEMLHRRIADSSKHIYDELKQASGDGSRVIPFQGRKIGVGGRRNLW